MHRDNLVVGCTTKPHDGLFYYSYEYAIALDCPLVIITHPDFEQSDYIDAINEKYTVCKNVVFDEDFFPADETCLLMGRSLLTVPYLNIDKYTNDQLMIMFLLFKRLIVVYSENHPEDYPKAVEYFKSNTYDLCDREVYPNGVGDHFEKHINFSIYKDPIDDVQFEHLFLGTNQRYYNTVEKTIDKYLDYVDHGILVYDDKYTRRDLNNVYVPVNNLLGKFKTYVYTKDYFDPAPRLIQECKYYGKDIIYARDKNIVDGGSVYYEREISKPNLFPINRALFKMAAYREYREQNFRKKNLNIECTNKCTLQCSLCKRTTHRFYNGNTFKGGDLTPQEFKKCLDYFHSFTFGGQLSDPIFGKHFTELLSMCSHKHTIVLTAATGKKLEWYDTAFDANPNAKWVFGIDGLPHNSSTYRKNQDGEFLFDVMLHAKKRNMQVQWQYIIFDYNKNQIQECKDLAEKHGIEIIFIDTLRNNINPKRPISKEMWITIKYSDGQKIKEKTNPKDLRPRCFREQDFTLSCEGYFTPCCWIDDELYRDQVSSLFDEKLKIHNNDSVEDIFNSEEWIDFFHILKHNRGEAPPVCYEYCTKDGLGIDKQVKKNDLIVRVKH